MIGRIVATASLSGLVLLVSCGKSRTATPTAGPETARSASAPEKAAAPERASEAPVARANRADTSNESEAMAEISEAGEDIPPADDVPTEDRAAMGKLLEAIRTHDKNALARLVRYPIDTVLDVLKTPRDFVAHYDDFFDAKTEAQVLEACKRLWHKADGTSCEAGELWMDEGKVYRFNLESDGLKAKVAEAKREDQMTLHPSVRGYDSLMLQCETKHQHIRIHEEGKQTRYIAWNTGIATSNPPSVSLLGTWAWDGNGGNRYYIFENGPYVYCVYDGGAVCSGTPLPDDPGSTDCDPLVSVIKRGQSAQKAEAGDGPTTEETGPDACRGDESGAHVLSSEACKPRPGERRTL